MNEYGYLIGQDIGEPVRGVRFAESGVVQFVTPDHKHGTWNPVDRSWQWTLEPEHDDYCSEKWPYDFVPQDAT